MTAQPVQDDRYYELRADVGLVAVVAGGEGALDGARWRALQAALDADEFAALLQEAATARGPLRPGLRAVLAHHLGHTPLRTRAVAQSVQRLLEARPQTRGDR
jgi:DNA repair protein RecO (recombination protein O)